MYSKEQFMRIASNCTEFQSIREGELTASTSISLSPSCEGCTHFTKEHKCALGLIDKVLDTRINSI